MLAGRTQSETESVVPWFVRIDPSNGAVLGQKVLQGEGSGWVRGVLPAADGDGMFVSLTLGGSWPLEVGSNLVLRPGWDQAWSVDPKSVASLAAGRFVSSIGWVPDVGGGSGREELLLTSLGNTGQVLRQVQVGWSAGLIEAGTTFVADGPDGTWWLFGFVNGSLRFASLSSTGVLVHASELSPTPAVALGNAMAWLRSGSNLIGVFNVGCCTNATPDIFLVQFSDAGLPLGQPSAYARFASPAASETAVTAIVLRNGNILVGGKYRQSPMPQRGLIIEFNSVTLEVVRQRTFLPAGGNFATVNALHETPEGNILAAGQVAHETEGTNAWLINVAPAGFTEVGSDPNIAARDGGLTAAPLSLLPDGGADGGAPITSSAISGTMADFHATEASDALQ